MANALVILHFVKQLISDHTHGDEMPSAIVLCERDWQTLRDEVATRAPGGLLGLAEKHEARPHFLLGGVSIIRGGRLPPRLVDAIEMTGATDDS